MIILFLINIILTNTPVFGNEHETVYQPKFAAPIVNLSIAVGREAIFKCKVHHLGKYKVGWVKADTKAIQAIDKMVITHNSRVSVTHESHNVWNLHIREVRDEDKGVYMCQINTDPMINQIGYLNVLIPPDFNTELTSSDILCTEGSTVRLKCTAQGRPPPKIMWRREDGREIIIRNEIVLRKHLTRPFGSYEPIDAPLGVAYEWGVANRLEGVANHVEGVANHLEGVASHKSSISEKYVKEKLFNTFKVNNFEGEILRLNKISRAEMGPYLCIASNGVPPSISKRITVHVHFPPTIYVPNQLVGAPLSTQVTLECLIESYPMAITYWVHNSGHIITSNAKYEISIIKKSIFEINMRLIIKKIVHFDLGTYKCVAKNSLGETENNIRLYEILGPTIFPFIQNYEDFEHFKPDKKINNLLTPSPEVKQIGNATNVAQLKLVDSYLLIVLYLIVTCFFK